MTKFDNEKYAEAWRILDHAKALPVGAERSAAVADWHGKMRDGSKLENIERMRDRQIADRSPDTAVEQAREDQAIAKWASTAARKDWSKAAADKPREIKPLPQRSRDYDRER